MKKIKRKHRHSYRLITLILIVIDVLAIIQVISLSIATFNTIPEQNQTTNKEESKNEISPQETIENNIQENDSITPELEQPIQEESPNNPTYTLETMPLTYQLDVPIISQYPELPTGCEITSLTILLNYLGYNIDKTTLAKNYLDYTYSTSITFSDAFIGNPFNNDGYGCFAPVIEKAAKKYLTSINSNYNVQNKTGTELENLLVEVANQHPIIVWTSMSLVDIHNKLVWTLSDGTKVYWPENEHVVVISGYNLENQTITVIDPMKGKGDYPLNRFQKIYNDMGKQAISIQ